MPPVLRPLPASAARNLFMVVAALSLIAAVAATAGAFVLKHSEMRTLYLRIEPTPQGTISSRFIGSWSGVRVLRFGPPDYSPHYTDYGSFGRWVVVPFILPVAWVAVYWQRRHRLGRAPRYFTIACALMPWVASVALWDPEPVTILATLLVASLLALLFLQLCHVIVGTVVDQLRRVTPAARRVRRGLCASCGYDLRATPDRCPECGAAAQSSGRPVSDSAR